MLVSGGSGYVAGWCLVQLLEAGHSARTTVRSLAKADTVPEAVAQHTAPDRLTSTVQT